MTTEALLARLRGLGVSLSTDGVQLRCNAPRGVLDAELKAALAEHKPRLVALLTSQAATRLEADAELEDSIRPDGRLPAKLPPRPSVFLTGATGFLGAQLLRSLLGDSDARVSCLSRSADEAAGLQRLEANLRHYGLPDRVDAERVRPVLGDLSKPFLGMGERRFAELAESVDLVIHAGALVHYLHRYEVMRPVNVTGAHQVLRLATVGRTKPIFHVSSARVFGYDHAGPVLEDVEPPPSAQLLDGYQQSKWVAEHAMWRARRRGLPVTIFRAGPLQGDSRTGAFNPVGFSTLFIRACATLGLAPDADFSFELTPVDVACRAMVAVALSDRPRAAAYHFRNPRTVRAAALWDAFGAHGRRIEVVPFADWLTRANARFPELSLWRDNSFQRYFQLEFECRNGLGALKAAGLWFPEEDALLALYVPAWISGRWPAAP